MQPTEQQDDPANYRSVRFDSIIRKARDHALRLRFSRRNIYSVVLSSFSNTLRTHRQGKSISGNIVLNSTYASERFAKEHCFDAPDRSGLINRSYQ